MDDGEREDEAVAQHKFEQTAATLDIEDLKRRVWLKARSKVDVPNFFEWEVGVKHGDDRPSAAEMAVPFAVLRVSSEPARFTFPFTSVKEVVMTVDREDVGFMADSLKRLAEALEAVDSRHDG